jgi:hypothetical protein
LKTLKNGKNKIKLNLPFGDEPIKKGSIVKVKLKIMKQDFPS